MLPLLRSLVPSVTLSPVRMISTTNVCFAEPLKKRKKVDIEILKMRQERKVKKLEREIRRMKKTPRQLKPIEEYSLPPKIVREMDSRTRQVDQEFAMKVEKDISKMTRLWSDYLSAHRKQQRAEMQRVLGSQSRALNLLREIDEEMYWNAVAKNPAMDELIDDRMVKETPANPEYNTRDGKKIDISKEWFM